MKLKTVKTEKLNLNTFGEQNYKKQNCDVIELQLHKPGHDDTLKIKGLCFPTICSPLPSRVNVDYPHLDGLRLADDYDHDKGTIDILVGVDHYWDFIEGDCVRGDQGPTAINSKLGWILSGPLENSVNSESVISNLVISGDCDRTSWITQENDRLTDTLKTFWDTEHIGIYEQNQATDDDTRKIDEFISIHHDGERYSVDLPWKEDSGLVPTNYASSYNRLQSLHRKLKKSPELLTEYDHVIQDQLVKGIVEEVPNDSNEVNVETGNVHYM